MDRTMTEIPTLRYLRKTKELVIEYLVNSVLKIEEGSETQIRHFV